MACLQPLVRVEYPHITYMNKQGKICNKAVIYSQTEYDKEYEKIHDFYDGRYDIKTQLIPCGRCIGCRLDYSREWANRCAMEAELHEKNWFITLTYNEEHLPMKDFAEYNGKIYPRREDWTGTLVKSDLQKFIKRLRKAGLEFRYLACGEYGGEGGRPHYHMICFGADMATETFYNARYVRGNLYWQNSLLEKYWTAGFSFISEANWNTMAYVARYVTKKQYGQYANEEYAALGREKEFLISSKRPAIGAEYFNLHQEEIYEQDKILLHNTNGNFYAKPPRYFDKLRERYHDLSELKEHRKVYGESKARAKDATTSLRRKQQMEVEERTLDDKSRQLKRDMVTKGARKVSEGYYAQSRR